MKAIRYTCYGGPEKLSLETIEVPAPGPAEVRLRVRAAAVNPYDFHFMRGEPLFMRLFIGLRRPRRSGLGRDVAGVVDAVGPGVTQFTIGDEVYGAATGAFAEQAIGRVDELIGKPAQLCWEEAAAIPMAAFTGLQGLDRGRVGAGSRVLVNGASGGIGHFTVQMAKAMGAHVTAVCKTSNVDWVRGLGADEVVDYTRTSITDLPARFDCIIDTVANHSVSACGRLLAPGGTYVWLGSARMGRILGPLGRTLVMTVAGRRYQVVNAKRTRDDMERLNAFVAAGQLRIVIEHTFPLEQAGQAIAHVEAGHTKGKTVIQVS